MYEDVLEIKTRRTIWFGRNIDEFYIRLILHKSGEILLKKKIPFYRLWRINTDTPFGDAEDR